MSDTRKIRNREVTQIYWPYLIIILYYLRNGLLFYLKFFGKPFGKKEDFIQFLVFQITLKLAVPY